MIAIGWCASDENRVRWGGQWTWNPRIIQIGSVLNTRRGIELPVQAGAILAPNAPYGNSQVLCTSFDNEYGVQMTMRLLTEPFLFRAYKCPRGLAIYPSQVAVAVQEGLKCFRFFPAPASLAPFPCPHQLLVSVRDYLDWVPHSNPTLGIMKDDVFYEIRSRRKQNPSHVIQPGNKLLSPIFMTMPIIYNYTFQVLLIYPRKNACSL